MDWILDYLKEPDRLQVIHYGGLFLLAAFMHARQVRKEIQLQFVAVSAALNNVADALKQDLKSHSTRLDNIENDVKLIKTKLKVEP